MKQNSYPTRFHLICSVGFSLAALALPPSGFAMAAGTMNTSPIISGSTVTASDCSYGAVRDAVAAANAMNLTGLTVKIPAGTCEWGSSELVVPGRIALKGAGRDLTIIKRTAPVGDPVFLVKMECYIYKKAVFSAMTLEGSSSKLSFERGLGLVGTCTDFKVSNAKFTRFSYSGVEVRGGKTQSGVIYSSQFIDNYVPGISYGYGVAVYGQDEWPELKLGMEKEPGFTYPSAVFVENNLMVGNRHHIASNRGARYVFRHNVAKATDLTKDFPQVDAHGQLAFNHGTRSWEVYGNSFSATLKSGGSTAIGMRGGDGVIFGNSYGEGITKPIQLSRERQVNIDYANPANNCINFPTGTIDNIADAYINEVARTNLITNLCQAHIREGYEYRIGQRPGYTPFTHPHPLRTN